jgi:hypothetical protein
MYRDFLESKRIREGTLTSKAKPRPSDYEKHLKKIMKTYGITSPDELENEKDGNEVLNRFWQEVDETWEGIPDVVVNMPNMKSESLFPEQNSVQGRGSLDYGSRQGGEKSITVPTFNDGNLYSN